MAIPGLFNDRIADIKPIVDGLADAILDDIGDAVDCFLEPNKIMKAKREVGYVLATRGATKANFDAYGDAMLSAFEAGYGEGWTAAHHEAWGKCLETPWTCTASVWRISKRRSATRSRRPSRRQGCRSRGQGCRRQSGDQGCRGRQEGGGEGGCRGAKGGGGCGEEAQRGGREAREGARGEGQEARRRRGEEDGGGTRRGAQAQGAAHGPRPRQPGGEDKRSRRLSRTRSRSASASRRAW